MRVSAPLYHGAPRDQMIAIDRDGVLRSPKDESWGDERGLIWVSDDLKIAEQYARGWSREMHGIPSKPGAVYQIQKPFPLKAIDRFRKLNAEQAEKLNALNLRAHYDPIRAGVTLGQAMGKLSQHPKAPQSFAEILPILGFNALAYAGHQLGIAADTIPVKKKVWEAEGKSPESPENESRILAAAISFLKPSPLLEKMSYEDALAAFQKHTEDDVRKLSKDQLKVLRWKIAKKIHTDVGGDSEEIKDVNAAYDILSGKEKAASGRSAPPPPPKRAATRGRSEGPDRSRHPGTPEWAWAGYSGGLPPSSNIHREDYRDMNYFKKRMWELSQRSKQEWTIWAFDGTFFRSSITVYGNAYIYDKMAEAMVMWNSQGGNPYKTRAVFVEHGKTKTLRLIYLDGKHYSDPPIFHYNAFNNNPGNDQDFMRNLPEELDKISRKKWSRSQG